MIQGNINKKDKIYQFELAEYNSSISGISNLRNTAIVLKTQNEKIGEVENKLGVQSQKIVEIDRELGNQGQRISNLDGKIDRVHTEYVSLSNPNAGVEAQYGYCYIKNGFCHIPSVRLFQRDSSGINIPPWGSISIAGGLPRPYTDLHFPGDSQSANGTLMMVIKTDGGVDLRFHGDSNFWSSGFVTPSVTYLIKT